MKVAGKKLHSKFISNYVILTNLDGVFTMHLDIAFRYIVFTYLDE